MTDKKFYIDKGSELTDYYRPSGFRFLTNTLYIRPDGCVEEDEIDLIRNCWKYYDSVSVGPAFACNGFMMPDTVAIYVKRVMSIEFGKVCHLCEGHFEDKDIIHALSYYMDNMDICKNCFDIYIYEETLIGNKKVLVAKYKY